MHHDWFDWRTSNETHMQAGLNRYATVFIYLNDVEGGGETVFPYANREYIPDACTNPGGLRVRPRKGAVAVFFSMLPNGNLDFYSLHGACPVLTGEKYGANLWFWEPARTMDGLHRVQQQVEAEGKGTEQEEEE